MMMTPQHETLLQSPKLSSALNSLSVKRPSLSPLKRKLSDSEEEHTSPTSTEELDPATDVASPTKKVKLESSLTNWSTTTMELEEMQVEDGSDAACEKVLAAYNPVEFTATPAEELNEEEVDILNFFLL
ncbi:hypothetical protein Poli38472_014496 [Pythium oligandrum]|uniref:Uncharacterized protein n=2 Tax=Pythiaceae TaxID=4782 RepID=A0A8K1FEY1_PYTOL|nr:hypothetical protein Poli38472_014496 [Pythium oligandrum]DBA02610.1 TPA: hypothetical protein N0F65_011982 [Lagenidium giganteum]|eukprot:TMW61035.1 hypothetical protein Poli38472_014496 [Pythium oligandrum]